ncbi:MAG: LptF/LptG family permease [Campylobacterota bacterium]|nr:LptF/LptG family permease [Campylobacterota bacterium]
MLKIVDKYIIKQLIKTFLSSFIILTVLMLLAGIIQISHIVFARGTTLNILFKIFYQQATFVAIFTIPMALTVAVDFVYADFAKNNEIVAFQSSGISKSNLYKPALVFTIFIFFITFLNTSSIAYKQRGEFHLTLLQLAKHRIYSEISERSFFHFSKESVIYAETISPNTLELKSIFLQTPREIIMAKEGRFWDSSKGTIFSMKNGNMYKERGAAVEVTTFRKFSTLISPQRFVQQEEEIRKEPKYMSMWQLFHTKSDFAKMQINKMFALAFSVFILSLIAFSLGVISRAGKSAGFILCVGIFVLFYIFQIFGEGIAKSANIPFYMWLPNIILAIFGIILFLSVVRR